MRLQGKVAIVTGAGQGIGEATAKKFAKEGAKVVVVDLNEHGINSTVDAINKDNGEAIGIVVDVTNREQVQAMIERTVEQYGKLDSVVNNAGITADSTLAKMTDEQWENVIDVNLKGVYLVGQAAAKQMKEQGFGGTILNASSVVGLYGNYGQTNYAASKWGVIGMTKTWAKELGKDKIRSNAVAPGFIQTPMVEKMPEKVVAAMKARAALGILGEPEDIANAYVFLASDDARFITGAVLSVDGGMVI
ncbi:beta-ketoacyl-ACP reductase [Bacillus solimangrovi]|uniref:3-oxoacyl-[acyl-carrier-protein] reductase n=1 Tax=Bacillus solimangrovi TaxID=1305675 RepID=A0A1E5LIP9_9BACI|nr:beta-ketoacyl-ACP reductase [Bacillus solimangrovi]OEH93928.1 3-oxoacyl-[acyl-carrier-protein] reductase [Bacillus solimangrovi]